MRHDAHGWWIADAGAPQPLVPLSGNASADVVVVGGGYTGLWAAWHALEAGASGIVLEAGRAGLGPSGRNGGFVSSLAVRPPPPGQRVGAPAAPPIGARAGGRGGAGGGRGGGQGG